MVTGRQTNGCGGETRREFPKCALVTVTCRRRARGPVFLGPRAGPPQRTRARAVLDASTLRRFDASTLRRFDASTLRRFDVPPRSFASVDTVVRRACNKLAARRIDACGRVALRGSRAHGHETRSAVAMFSSACARAIGGRRVPRPFRSRARPATSGHRPHAQRSSVGDPPCASTCEGRAVRMAAMGVPRSAVAGASMPRSVSSVGAMSARRRAPSLPA
jgi:hypothetical protein